MLPKQGQVAVPFSFGLRMFTPIGATYFAWSIRLARADACDPTVTVRTPNSFVKTPWAGLVTLTLTVSFVRYLVERLTAGVPPPFLRHVLEGQRVRVARIRREGLSPRERRGVGRRLRGAIGAVPRPDVEHERRHAEQDDEKDECQDGCLAAVASRVHSTRSVVVLERRPVFTTSPSRLIL